jgi:hypothetical protein
LFLDLKLKNYSPGHLPSKPDEKQRFLERHEERLIALEKYLLDENSLLDADKIQADIFPAMPADVFISHSHSDREGAIDIALALERIGLTAFVDSCVWGHADDLLKKIDGEFCIPEGWTSYSYDLRNRTTTNVHLILNSALQGMIERSELFIFIESKNSVKVGEYVNKSEFLSSPWIHSELMFANRVRRSERRNFNRSNESLDLRKAEASDLTFAYNIPESTKAMNFFEFVTWLEEFPDSRLPGNNAPPELPGLNHLDRLYRKLRVADENLDTPRWEAY